MIPEVSFEQAGYNPNIYPYQYLIHIVLLIFSVSDLSIRKHIQYMHFPRYRCPESHYPSLAVFNLALNSADARGYRSVSEAHGCRSGGPQGPQCHPFNFPASTMSYDVASTRHIGFLSILKFIPDLCGSSHTWVFFGLK